MFGIFLLQHDTSCYIPRWFSRISGETNAQQQRALCVVAVGSDSRLEWEAAERELREEREAAVASNDRLHFQMTSWKERMKKKQQKKAKLFERAERSNACWEARPPPPGSLWK